jgi:F-type H+-transporting ATPase subunit b
VKSLIVGNAILESRNVKRPLAPSFLRRSGLFALAVGLLVLAGTAARADEEHGGPGTAGTDTAAEHVEAEHGEHEEGAPSIDPKKLGLQLLNFGVLVFILVKFGGGAINKMLRSRHEQLKADLASASELRAAAEAKLKKQEARLASLEHEIADMRRGLKAEAEAEKARLIAAAEERATRIKAETAFLIEQQVRDAEQRLRRESADAALKIAEEILKKSIGVADQQKLVETFVGDVERAPAGRSA